VLLEPYLRDPSSSNAPQNIGLAELLAALATVDPQKAARILDDIPRATRARHHHGIAELCVA